MKRALIGLSSIFLFSCAQNTGSIMTLEEKNMLFEATAKIIQNQEEIKERLSKLEKQSLKNKTEIKRNSSNIAKLNEFTKNSMRLNFEENKKISSIIMKINKDINTNKKQIQQLKSSMSKIEDGIKPEKIRKIVLEAFKESYTTAKVNLRKRPDRFSRKLASIEKNTKITVKGWTKGKDGEIWLNVRYLDLDGYVLAKYVRPIDK